MGRETWRYKAAILLLRVGLHLTAHLYPNFPAEEEKQITTSALISRGHREGFGRLPVHFCQVEDREQEQGHPKHPRRLEFDPEREVIDQDGRQRPTQLRQRRDGGLR